MESIEELSPPHTRDPGGLTSLKGKRTKRHHLAPRPSTPTASSSSSTTTEEDEDMAHCLILLARGRVFDCKTCNKTFPSFQALGGHRASHKKPRIDEDGLGLSANFFSRALNSGKTKVHECSVCGTEFSSGQALGGHMRRHRPPAIAAGKSPEVKKGGTVLLFDLNLPATADDEAEKRLGFETKGAMGFSSGALVNCL